MLTRKRRGAKAPPRPRHVEKSPSPDQPESTPAPDPAPPPPGEIWECYDDATGQLAGLLVSERGNVAAVVAFIPRLATVPPDDDGGEGDPIGRPGRGWATAIAADFDQVTHSTCLDLREFARRDSTAPTPGQLYRLRVAPLGRGPRVTRALFPFCPVRLARLVAQQAALQWTKEERREYPELQIGIWESGGSSMSILVGVDPHQVDLPF